jgi:aminopeptidase N
LELSLLRLKGIEMLESDTPAGVKGGENMSRPVGPMTAQIENFIRMEARGEPHDVVLREIFGPECVTDKVKKNAAESKMDRWRHRADHQAIWDDEMKARVRRRVPAAVERLEKQIDSDNDWVANKAANDYINLAKTVSVFQSEEKAINVKIEGMPEIGSPDGD